MKERAAHPEGSALSRHLRPLKRDRGLVTFWGAVDLLALEGDWAQFQLLERDGDANSHPRKMEKQSQQ